MTPRAAPLASTNAVRGALAGSAPAAGRAVMVPVLIGGAPRPAGSGRLPAPPVTVAWPALFACGAQQAEA
jgi:hypothetical protein